MNPLTDSELFDRYLSIYWVCESVKYDIQKNPWTHPGVIPEANEFEMEVAYNHMERLIPAEHFIAIRNLVYG